MKCLVNNLRGTVQIGFIHSDGNFNFRCRNHTDLNVGIGQRPEHRRGNTGMGTHPDTDDGNLAKRGFRFYVGIGSQLRQHRLQSRLCTPEIVHMHGKRLANQTVMSHVGDDHIQIDFRITQNRQNFGGITVLNRDIGHCYAGLVTFN